MKFRVFTFILALVVILSAPATAFAIPASPNINGDILDAEWNSGSDNANCGPTSTLNDVDLYITWDTDNLYIGLKERTDTGSNYLSTDRVAVYLDTAGGGTRDSPLNGSTIAGPDVGYEYAFVTNAGFDDYYVGDFHGWLGPELPPGNYDRVTAYNAPYRAAEFQIPRVAVDLSPNGSQVGVLVQVLSGDPLATWPDVPGNDQTGNATQAYKLTLNNSGTWICASAPTAVSLTDLSASATPPAVNRVIVPVMFTLLGLVSGVRLLHRRVPHQSRS